MKTEIEKTLEILKERVETNKQILVETRKVLKNVINQPVSNERTELFTHHFKVSNNLYLSSFQYIRLQHELQRAINQKNGLKTFGMMSLS